MRPWQAVSVWPGSLAKRSRCYLTAEVDELWKRIAKRDLEGRWGSRSIQRHELDEWAHKYEPPTDEEFRTYDGHAIHNASRQ